VRQAPDGVRLLGGQFADGQQFRHTATSCVAAILLRISRMHH
jgi:hypothetical protein